jgi:hypothetical protein
LRGLHRGTERADDAAAPFEDQRIALQALIELCADTLAVFVAELHVRFIAGHVRHGVGIDLVAVRHGVGIDLVATAARKREGQGGREDP